MKIGLYGGTFDPIHNAHLIISQYIKEELHLDKIIFIPSANPPHKSTFSQPKIRLKMVYSATKNNASFQCSELEIHQERQTYSVDTIRQIKRGLDDSGGCDLFWIMGSDNFISFDTWKNPREICTMTRLVIFPRNHNDVHLTRHEFKEKAIYLKKAPIIDISSTYIRSLVKSGRSIKYLVPEIVEDIIVKEKLYL